MKHLVPSATKSHGSLAAYVVGFMLSIIFTLVAYYAVEQHTRSGHLEFSHGLLIGLIAVLAIAQLGVQLFFFLHLGKESKPRHNLQAFLFAALVVIIVVFGSIWIMNNLNYNMTGEETEQYLIEEEGIRH